MTRLVVACALAFGLAACASAPKKSASVPVPHPDAAGTRVAPLSGRKVSPYAPAQEDPGKRGDYVRGGLYAPHIADAAPDAAIDVDAIPEPDVVSLPRSRYGNRSPYAVLGKNYDVLADTRDYVETGTASYYGTKFHGRRTSNLEVYDMYAFSAAHRSLPLPSFARVTNLDTGRSVVVRVNDRGPFHHGRLIDLSYAAAVKLGITQRGTGRVEVRALQPDGSQPGTVYAAAPSTPATGTPRAVAALDIAVDARRTPAPSSALDTLVAAMPIASAQAGALTPAATPARSDTSAAIGTTTAPASAASAAAGASDFRFDMQQNGKPMSADEFEAWMRARQVRVATGKPGVPTPASTPVAPASASTPSAPAFQSAAPGTQSSPPVTLQVASFAARANADRALSMLREAGIANARLFDGQAGGKAVYRLRVGTDVARIGELSSRIVGLGFGTPQRVRD